MDHRPPVEVLPESHSGREALQYITLHPTRRGRQRRLAPDCGRRWLDVGELSVCTENLNPVVAVMEAAEDGNRFNASYVLNRTRDRRIFI